MLVLVTTAGHSPAPGGPQPVNVFGRSTRGGQEVEDERFPALLR
jgi:hypothetical protein